MPNWPTFETADEKVEENNDEGKAKAVPSRDPDATNITWFRTTDFDRSGGLSRNELITGHNSDSWYDQRFRIAIEKLIQEADEDGNRIIDMPEFVIGQTPPRILMGAVKFASSATFQFNLQDNPNKLHHNTCQQY